MGRHGRRQCRAFALALGCVSQVENGAPAEKNKRDDSEARGKRRRTEASKSVTEEGPLPPGAVRWL